GGPHAVPPAKVTRQPPLETCLERLVVERVADGVAHLVERLVAGGDVLLGAQQMEAGHGLDRLAHLARLQPKGRVLERLLHLAAGEGADLAPFLGARALRELPRSEERRVGEEGRCGGWGWGG